MKKACILLLQIIMISCAKESSYFSTIELSVVNNHKITSYQFSSNGSCVYLVNESGKSGRVYRAKLGTEYFKTLENALVTFSNQECDSVNAIITDGTRYLIQFKRNSHSNIEFLSSSCENQQELDKIVMAFTKKVDTAETYPYFQTFERILPKKIEDFSIENSSD